MLKMKELIKLRCALAAPCGGSESRVFFFVVFFFFFCFFFSSIRPQGAGLCFVLLLLHLCPFVLCPWSSERYNLELNDAIR